jgi:hypothetical protein
MVLGAVSCPVSKSRQIADEIRCIKVNHKLPPWFEVKWTKASPAKADFYLEIIRYFFDNRDLAFRAVVIPDKSRLEHDKFSQTHDEWYYKMYFTLLKTMLEVNCSYRFYLDIKDTRSGSKARGLEQVLRNSNYDFDARIIERVQNVHSHEIQQLQLTDLLIGAVGYANRGLHDSKAKESIVERLKRLSGYSLTRTTLLRERKCNILIWRAQEDT